MEYNLKGGRKDYIDVLKFLGIFAIYLGHCGESAGRFYPFVFSYHVPLFFFVSGCMEHCSADRSFVGRIVRKIKTLLLPWMVFALLICVFNAANGTMELKTGLMLIAKGCVRNQFTVAGGLWFLTCLFVVNVAFYPIKKTGRTGALLISVLFFAASQTVLPNRPQQNPAWYWNIDSAMYYSIFYSFGYFSFPAIDQALTRKSKVNVLSICSLGWVSIFYSTLLFWGKDVLARFSVNLALDLLIQFLRPMLVITLMLLLAYFLRDIAPLKRMGRDSLYLCCSESIVHTLVYTFARTMGLAISIFSQDAAVVYVAFLLFVSEKFLIPFEKQLMNRLYGIEKTIKNLYLKPQWNGYGYDCEQCRNK